MSPNPSQLQLTVVTPIGTVLAEPARAVRAEDASGFFGIRPGHETLFTCLEVGIVTYRGLDGRERYLAVRRGLLWTDGRDVIIATRDAAGSENLADLEEKVLSSFRRADEEERRSNQALTRLQIAALRRLLQFEDTARSASP